jgi:hypothetical protein
MIKRVVLLSILVFFGFFVINSVSLDQKSVSLEQKTLPGLDKRSSSWTVMVYLDGDNDLESAAIDDFLKIASAVSSPNINIVTQFDRIEGYDTRYGDWTGTKRFHVTKGMTPTAENAILNVGEVNMGDPVELVDFLHWSKTNYPASNYALLFWDHGNGGQKTKAQLWREWSQREKKGLLLIDLCRDETSAGDSLDMEEVKKALDSGAGAHLIGFAGKLTDLLETAYELKDCGQVMVGHGEIEPPGGWPFDAIINDLTANSSWSALQLGTAIANRYYEAHGPDVTQAVVELGKMDSLIAKIRIFAKQMIASWDNDRAAVKKAAGDVITKIEHTVVNQKFRLPIYFPGAPESFNPSYNGSKINFAGASHWREFLQTFFNSMQDSWIAETRSASGGFYHPAYIDLYGFCESISRPQTQEDYYSESVIGHDYFGEGSARNFQKDDDYMTFGLPFDFPYFGTIIQADTDIYISSNGYIDFDSNSSHIDHTNTSSELISNKRIAPCWADLSTDGSAQRGEDIYITSNPGFLAIRWVAETYGDQKPVNFEVVLFANGYIQFNYGNENEYINPWDTAPTIGISKGDSTNYYFSEYNGETWLTNVDSDLFKHRAAVTVTSPDGGEEWAEGTAHGITWSTIGNVGDVMIEYSANSGETWNNIISSTDNDGFFRWIVPSDRSENCKVRVSESDLDGGPGDDSNQVFTIAAASTAAITIVSPNGGEQLTVDTQFCVTWANSGEVGNVKIDYSTTGGETWTNIVESIDNTGSYDWTVPNNTANNCRIRVSERDGNPVDISDELFSIVSPASITLTSPNGGEEWGVGSAHNITWTSGGPIGDVRIDYSTTGGETWINIALSTANDGSCNWTVPNTISENCKVRVSKSDSEVGPADVSDQTFSIEQATAIIVTSPNGGERFEVEATCEITWDSSGEVGNVKIDYSTTGGETWTNIVQSTDNNGRYYWTVPGNTSDTCKIRVSETDGEPYAVSAGVFAIIATPSITVASPNGYESWAAGSSHTIIWTHTGIIGSVFIEYSIDGGTNWATITAATPNTGSFGWIVPNTPSQNCLMRIKALDTDGYPVDASNSSFTITNN